MKEKLKYNSIITARIVLYTVKRFMVTFLGVMLLINLLPTEMIPESGETAIIPEAFAATTLHNPGIVADSSMASGQKVTWDCIYFGTYPQTEIVDEIPQCGTYGKSWSLLSDYDVDLTLYSKLTKADWDSRGDAYINGTKYHRVKSSNATYSNSGDYWYHWDSNESYHYFRYDKIKWRVLQKEGQKVFLLSDSILDDKRYNEKTGSSSANRITWETSTLRSWLNGKGSDANNNQIDFTGKGFIDVAFNNTEKCAIEDVNVDNHSTAPTAGTNGGNDTNDKVFLLSEYDMFYSDRSASYGFCKNS